MHRFPMLSTSLTRVVPLFQWMSVHGHIIITQSPSLPLAFTLGAVHSWDQCIMTCIHHYGIIWSIFTALKILCALLIHLSFHPQPLTTTDLFIVSILSSFPECHRVGIIQYVAFSDWLLSVSDMHLSFLHVFLWLDKFISF